jgi:hypothetical protein
MTAGGGGGPVLLHLLDIDCMHAKELMDILLINVNKF